MIILASQSPARRAMLNAAGVPHTAIPAHIDEDGITQGLLAAAATPEHIADALAELKAVKISRSHPGTLVLGADSVAIAADGSYLAKPETRTAAAAQLAALSKTTHRLISAAVIAENGTPVWRATATARLTMRALSAGFIAQYLAAEDDGVLACVGSYRIEGLGAQLFARVEGDHFTIRGLPLLALLDYLRTRSILTS